MIERDRIEKVCRAICAELGENPDHTVSISAQFTPHAPAKTVKGPQWHKHIAKAKTYIAAHDALTNA